jgi:hypothetical protein
MRAPRWIETFVTRRRANEKGAVMVEFAIILPLLVTITFGIIEFSSAYHDAAVASDAVRSGGRVGSALASQTNYASQVVSAANSAVETLPANAPQELWIYKANANGYPGSANNFSSCATNCIRYTWNSSTKTFGNPQGGGWPASTHQICRQPYDEMGVYVKLNHEFVTKLFGANITLTDHSVFRFEPVANSLCS